MDIFLLILGFVFVILGIIGSFLPILPGPLTSWVGLLLLYFTKIIPVDYTFLGITLAIALLIFVLDYFIPAFGTKRFGGTKYGVYGTTIGLLIGLFSPIPFGMLLGAFFGAFIGVNVVRQKRHQQSFESFIWCLFRFFSISNY